MVLSQQASQLARRRSYGVRYPTDEALLAGIASGVTSAFDTIFDRYYRPINNFIRRQIEGTSRGDEMVEDITQEVFMRVFKSARTFNGDKKFSSWIFKIASNEVKRHWKVHSTRQTISLNLPIDKDDSYSERGEVIKDLRAEPATLTEQELISRNLRAQIERLPAEQRTVVLLKTYRELTYAEISEICACPLSTVLSRMRYAVCKLRESLGLLEHEMPQELRPTW